MFAQVAFPIPVRRTFAYSVPETWLDACHPGVEVQAPFGARGRRGVVVSMMPTTALSEERVKPLARVLAPEAVIDVHGLALAHWMSGYYLCSLGEAIAVQLPGGIGLARSRARREAVSETPAPPPAALPRRLTWSTAQVQAIAAIRKAVLERQFRAFLLHGVTGSGKTEVYLEAALAARESGGHALLLVPEVSLAHSVVAEARRRFGARVGVLHSYMTVGERRATWERCRRGAFDLVVGARSAVFAPLPDLRLIVVDEEHEPAYKQSEQIRYHGRDVAVMRARLLGVPCVLGSATPSLESYANARRGKYINLGLPERIDRRPLPTVEIVERAGNAGGGNSNERQPDKSPSRSGPSLLTPRLTSAIESALARGEQVLLFLNRRGHSRVVECEACGYAARCPHCDLTLTFHSTRGRFLCHYCDHAEEPRPACPACGDPFFRYRIPGTQRIERELAALWEGIPVQRLDSDSARRAGAAADILESFSQGRPGILLGTQLVTKGHDFPGVTLVGVLDADSALHFPDFRAAERTFQLLTQVAGRAGRGERPGHVILQTHHPDHPALVAASQHDYAGFAAAELAVRHAAGYPPWTRLVALLVSGAREERVIEAAERIAEWATGMVGGPAHETSGEPAPASRNGHGRNAGVPALAVGAGEALEARATETLEAGDADTLEVLGPAPQALPRLRGRFRWQVTLRGRGRQRLLEVGARVLERADSEKLPAGVKLVPDVDPLEML